MEILSIDHIQLAIPPASEDKARAFYLDILGFLERKKPDALAERGGLWLQSGDVHLHLGVMDDFHPATKAHPGLVVKDLAKARDCLISHQIPVIEDENADGWDRIFTSDPFGNRLELIQYK